MNRRAFADSKKKTPTSLTRPGFALSSQSRRFSQVQTKLSIHQPGDAYEQEADRMAEHVMRMSDPGPSISSAVLGRKPQSTQPRTGGDCTAPSIVSEVLRSPSQPLDSATRAFMEPRFGHDFSSVRVHTDAHAEQSARAVNALAYTVGRDVVFGSGHYNPRTSDGQRLIAHELTHVSQQASSRPSLQRQAVDVDDLKKVRQRATVKKAVEHAKKLANRAQVRMGGENVALFTRWYDRGYTADRQKNSTAQNTRFDFVKKGWIKIDSIFKSREIVFEPAEAAKKKSVNYAYVYPKDGSYKIFLDQQFWNAKYTGKDSKAGTILHELAHEEVYTQDLGYGQKKASLLAKDRPDDAILNSDNWEYFAEDSN